SRGDMLDWGYIVNVCDQADVTLATPAGILYQPGDDNSRLMLWFKGGMSEAEKRRIRERLMRGKNQAVTTGALLMAIAPLGYRFEQYGKQASQKRLVIVEEAADTVRLLFRLVAYGPGDGEFWGSLRICH